MFDIVVGVDDSVAAARALDRALREAEATGRSLRVVHAWAPPLWLGGTPGFADPEVLVLDEPTAHLDPGTEALVLADLLRATHGRTVLLSTHRLAGLRELDEVHRVAGGTLRVETAHRRPVAVPDLPGGLVRP